MTVVFISISAMLCSLAGEAFDPPAFRLNFPSASLCVWGVCTVQYFMLVAWVSPSMCVFL